MRAPNCRNNWRDIDWQSLMSWGWHFQWLAHNLLDLHITHHFFTEIRRFISQQKRKHKDELFAITEKIINNEGLKVNGESLFLSWQAQRSSRPESSTPAVLCWKIPCLADLPPCSGKSSAASLDSYFQMPAAPSLQLLLPEPKPPADITIPPHLRTNFLSHFFQAVIAKCLRQDNL